MAKRSVSVSYKSVSYMRDSTVIEMYRLLEQDALIFITVAVVYNGCNWEVVTLCEKRSWETKAVWCCSFKDRFFVKIKTGNKKASHLK